MTTIPGHLWVAMTVLMESRGEPYEGQLAVAWVIRNRMERRKQSAIEVVLAPQQFSCWNTMDVNRAKLGQLMEDWRVWGRARHAAEGALYGYEKDPTGGADHFLAKDSLKVLPSWWDVARETVTLGRLTFARL